MHVRHGRPLVPVPRLSMAPDSPMVAAEQPSPDHRGGLRYASSERLEESLSRAAGRPRRWQDHLRWSRTAVDGLDRPCHKIVPRHADGRDLAGLSRPRYEPSRDGPGATPPTANCSSTTSSGCPLDARPTWRKPMRSTRSHVGANRRDSSRIARAACRNAGRPPRPPTRCLPNWRVDRGGRTARVGNSHRPRSKS